MPLYLTNGKTYPSNKELPYYYMPQLAPKPIRDWLPLPFRWYSIKCNTEVNILIKFFLTCISMFYSTESLQIYPTRSWHTNGYTQISLLQLQNGLLAFLRSVPRRPAWNLTKIQHLLLTNASIVPPIRILSLAHNSSSATPLVLASNLHDSRRLLSHSRREQVSLSL